MFRWMLFVLAVICLSSNAEASRPFATSATEVRPILNGQFVPDVTIQDIEGNDIQLQSLIDGKPTVILFYRGGWCPYCNRQMSGLIEVEQQILNLGFQIIAISPDSPERLYEQRVSSDDFAVVRLSDSNLEAIQSFGLGYFVTDDMVKFLRNQVGARLTTPEGEEKVVLPVPAAFVVDSTGLVLFQYVNPNYKVRIEPQLLYHAARLSKQ